MLGWWFPQHLPLTFLSDWKTDGYWRMTVDCQKLNQLVTPVAAAVPNVLSLTEQTNSSCNIECNYLSISLKFLINCFFLLHVDMDHQKQPAFSCQGQQYSKAILPQIYINFLALYHNLSKVILIICLFRNITLVHYIGNIVLTGPSEQDVATIFTH